MDELIKANEETRQQMRTPVVGHLHEPRWADSPLSNVWEADDLERKSSPTILFIPLSPGGPGWLAHGSLRSPDDANDSCRRPCFGERFCRRAIGLRAAGKDLTICDGIAYSARMEMSSLRHPIPRVCPVKSLADARGDALYGRFHHGRKDTWLKYINDRVDLESRGSAQLFNLGVHAWRR